MVKTLLTNDAGHFGAPIREMFAETVEVVSWKLPFKARLLKNSISNESKMVAPEAARNS